MGIQMISPDVSLQIPPDWIAVFPRYAIRFARDHAAPATSGIDNFIYEYPE